MADDNEILLKLNLDQADFVNSVLKAQESLKGLGAKENVEGLTETFNQLKGTVSGLVSGEGGFGALTESILAIAGPLAAVAAAGIALKTVFDLSLEAEQINQINAQFELLTKNAGLSTEALEQGLKKASQGLIDDTDLLKAANQAIVRMGSSAEKLPEIMNLAVQATRVFGGTAQSNFEQLTTAIGNGNTRMLKHLGIVIDAQAAIKKFADANNIAADSISEAGKRQAILNEVLAQGAERFKGAGETVAPMTEALQQIKVIMKDIGETVSLVFGKLFGSSIATALTAVKNFVSEFKDGLQAAFGTGKNQIQGLENELQRLMATQKKLTDQMAAGGAKYHWWNLVGIGSSPESDLQKTNAAIDEAQRKLAALKGAMPAETKAAGPTGAAPKEDIQDKTKVLQENAKFEQDLYNLRKQRIDNEIKDATTEEQLAAAQAQRRIIMEQGLAAEISKIRASTALNANQKEQLITEATKANAEKQKSIEKQSLSERTRMWDNYANDAKTQMQGITRGAEAEGRKQSLEFQKGTKAGAMAFQSLGKFAVDSFKGIGAAATQGADALRDAMLRSIGDIASNYGQTMLLASLFPFNPPVAAAGGALIALGSILGAAGGASGNTSAGGGSGNPSVSDTSLASTGPSISTASPTPQKAVTIAIQGNYLETDQTKQHLVDLIRSASDATDYQVLQVGQT